MQAIKSFFFKGSGSSGSINGDGAVPSVYHSLSESGDKEKKAPAQEILSFASTISVWQNTLSTFFISAGLSELTELPSESEVTKEALTEKILAAAREGTGGEIDDSELMNGIQKTLDAFKDSTGDNALILAMRLKDKPGRLRQVEITVCSERGGNTKLCVRNFNLLSPRIGGGLVACGVKTNAELLEKLFPAKSTTSKATT